MKCQGIAWLFLLCASVGVVSAQTATDAQSKAEEQKGITQIILQRTWCYGPCPIDRLVLNSDGTAIYEGRANVEKVGLYNGTFWKPQFKLLSEQLEKQGLLDFKFEIGEANIDTPDTILTVMRDRLPVTVVNHSIEGSPVLWMMEKAIVGFATGIRWKKDESAGKSGIKGIFRRPLSEEEATRVAKIDPKIEAMPIPYAEVYIYPINNYKAFTRCYTNQTGRFDVLLPPGKYQVSANIYNRESKLRTTFGPEFSSSSTQSQTLEVVADQFAEVSLDYGAKP
jgi:hypothetical protein